MSSPRRPERGSNPEAVKLATAVIWLRGQQRMTQAELIKSLPGDKRGPVQDLETGRRVPRNATQRDIANVFDMTLPELWDLAEKMAKTAERRRPSKAR